MRARIFLIFIIVATAFSLFTYGYLDIFQETKISILEREIILNSEMIISLIVLLTLILVLAIGLIDKLFFTKKPKEMVETKED